MHMIILVLAVFGLVMGSFVNALVWRVYMQEKRETKKAKSSDPSRNEISITKGRSMCPHCHHTLAAGDLVPVFSWLFLRGKCRYCHKSIGWQYPLVELATSLLFVLSYLFWPLDWNSVGIVNFIAWLVLITGFMALLVYDIRWMLLPNRIIYPLLIFALIIALYNIAIADDPVNLLTNIALSVAISGGIFYLIFQFSNGRWIGGGDVKLGALIGLVLMSPTQAFLVLLLASLRGTMVILPGLLLKKVTPSSRIPFGPFLIVAAILLKLFGESLIAWYERTLLITE